MQSVDVRNEHQGERLDQFLAKAAGCSRSQAQKLIRSGVVFVDAKTVSAHYALKAGQRVTYDMAKRAIAKEVIVPLTILQETPSYLVLYKSVGVVVHPAPSSTAPALTTALVARYPEIADVGDPARPGIVHRLDRDVSGVLVVARTPECYEHLKKEFAGRRVKKIYTALVEGVPAKEEEVIEFALERSKRTGRIAARPKGGKGRAAETRFVVLQRFAHHALLSVTLVTGRMHQIRAHLKAFRHPLVGDPLYGKKKPTLNAPRPFLQATTLGFTDEAGQWQEFTVPLDKDLVALLATL